VNFLFDENLPAALARALHELGEPVRHVVDVDDLGKGSTDAEIIPYAARWDYRLVSRDKSMAKPSQLKALIHAEGVGLYLFRLGRARQPPRWDLIQNVIRHWPSIVEHARATEPPYGVQIRRSGGVKPFS
jgi:hypothetical protein